ncbi:MAG: hypothetical protein KAG18_02490, partial [Sinobacterium sp.]|nr:hypothetical protein [Sinobacterium sp.]
MKALHLWKKIIAAVLIILVILGTSIFLARVYLLNNIVTYYLPENASFSIGSWPLNADGVTLEDATLHIPDVISLSLKNITIGIPALIENGFLLSSLSVKDTQLELLSDKNTSTTIRLHHLQLIGIELLETPPSSKVQNEQEEGINYKISAFKVSLNKSGIRLKSPQDEQNLTVSTINVNNVAVDLSAMNAAQAEPGVKLGKLQIAGVELTITKNNELPLNISLSAVTAKQLLMASLKSIKLKAFNISDFSATSHVVARQLVIDNINLIGLSNKIVASEPSAPDSLPVKSETLRLDAMTFSGITHNYTENHNYYDKASALFTQSSLDLKKVNLVNQQQLIVDTITLDKTFLKLALDKAGILNLTDITTGNGNPEQEEANQKKLRAGIWQLFSQLFKRQQ